MLPPIYCLSFPDSERRARLQRRLDQVGVTHAVHCAPLTPSDVAAMVASKGTVAPPGFEYRTAAVMSSHLAMMRRFLEETSDSHAIFCEDDVHLRKTFAADVRGIVREFDTRGLDVLLLGYLWPWKEAEGSGYRFHEYDAQLWGTQMFMLSRPQAMHLVQTYTLDWGLAHWPAQPFAADWIITKVGRRLRLSPMLAVEEGHVATTDAGQIDFHRRCAEANYDPARYV